MQPIKIKLSSCRYTFKGEKFTCKGVMSDKGNYELTLREDNLDSSNGSSERIACLFDKESFTLREVSEITGLSLHSIRKFNHDGSFKSFKKSNKPTAKNFVKRSDLIEWLDKRAGGKDD